MGPERELHVRAAAPRSGGARRRGAHGGAAAAVCRRRPERSWRTRQVEAVEAGAGARPWRRTAFSRRAGSATATDSSWSDALARSLSTGDPAVRDLLLGGAQPKALGSNNWVVDGTLTASGKPLLANDPHLGAQLPSLWYLAHMTAGDFDVIGATLPGAPAVAIGRNRFIAWGETNVAADVQDLYRERLDASGTHAEFSGAQEPLTDHPGNHRRQGRRRRSWSTSASPVTGRSSPTRSTRTTPSRRRSRSRRRSSRSPSAGRRSTTRTRRSRRSSAERGAQLDAIHRRAPRLRRPRRRISSTRTSTATSATTPPAASRSARRGDGSTPGAKAGPATPEWTGWIPFEELPHVYDPPEHFIVTANHRPAPPATRISRARIAGAVPRAADHRSASRRRRKLTPDDFARIQADTLSLHAQTLLPLLLAHAHPEDAAEQQAVDLLRSGTSTPPPTAPRRRSFRPGSFSSRRRSPATSSVRSLTGRLRRALLVRHALRRQHADRRRQPRGATIVTTGRRETCDDAVTRALQHARGRSDRAAGRRHDALAVGRRAPRGLSASRPRRGRAAAAAAQPLGAERRRLEHRQRRRRWPPTGRSSSTSPGLPRRSSICRQPTTAASSMPSGSPAISCRRTTTISLPGLARRPASEDAHGAQRHRQRRDRSVAADALTCSAGLSGPRSGGTCKGPPDVFNGC